MYRLSYTRTHTHTYTNKFTNTNMNTCGDDGTSKYLLICHRDEPGYKPTAGSTADGNSDAAALDGTLHGAPASYWAGCWVCSYERLKLMMIKIAILDHQNSMVKCVGGTARQRPNTHAQRTG